MKRACLVALMMVAAGAMHAPRGHAQAPPTDAAGLAEYCQRQPCRRDVSVRVVLADGRVQEESRPLHRPAILRESISVLLGETLDAVADFEDEQFRGWRAPARRESSRTPLLTLRLEQSAGDGSIAVAISNAGRDPVKLRLYVRTPGALEGEYTSSCPVPGGGTIYEYWDRPVIEVIVREAALLPDAALLCD